MNGQMTFNAFLVLGNMSIKNILYILMQNSILIIIRICGIGNICLLDIGTIIMSIILNIVISVNLERSGWYDENNNEN